MKSFEEQLADDLDMDLDQLAIWAGIPYKRVRQFADGEIEISDVEAIRLKSVIALAGAYHDRCVALAEVLDKQYGPWRQPKPGKNGSVGR